MEGWVRGTVARRSRTVGYSHVVRYDHASALRSAGVPSLLDAALAHGLGGRWVRLLLPVRLSRESGFTLVVRPLWVFRPTADYLAPGPGRAVGRRNVTVNGNDMMLRIIG